MNASKRSKEPTEMAIFSEAHSKLLLTVKTKLRYYVYCTRPASFFLVLIFGHSFVKYAVVSILVSYLTSGSETGDLLTAAIITNVLEGLASVLMIVVAHVADTLLGQVKMTIITSLSYVVGLLLLWVLNMTDKLGYGVFMVVVVLIALGQAGREPTLKSSFSDQLRDTAMQYYNTDLRSVDQSQISDEKQLEARTTFLWRSFRFVGAATATLIVSFIDTSWGLKFGISSAVMGTGFFIFLPGTRFYHRRGLTESPLTKVFQVFNAAIRKRGLPSSADPNDYYKNDFDERPLMPDIPFFRWLDKAALVSTTTLSLEQQENMWKLCTVTQVKDVKRLLRMSPMWGSFLVYSLVSAAGSTFFFEQSSKLDDQIFIGFNFVVPLTFFYFIQKFSSALISTMYEFIIPKSWSKEKKYKATRLRMGVGMACSFLCCVVAWQVETQRLNKLAKYTDEELEDENTDMSIFILAPQFCLLGLMEGLAEDGLYGFFHYQVVESMRSYGPSFNEFVLGIGKFISIFFMLVFSSWFGDTIDKSKVNNYYGVLALASLGNIFIFSFVSKYVYGDFIGKKKNMIDEMEEHGKRIQTIENSSEEKPPERENSQM